MKNNKILHQANDNNQVQALQQRVHALEISVASSESIRQKDFWEKFSSISTFLSTVVLGVVAMLITASIDQQNIKSRNITQTEANRIRELEVVAKMIPYLADDADEEKQKQAILALNILGRPELAAQFAISDPTPGKTKALYAAAQAAKEPEDRAIFVEAIKNVQDLRPVILLSKGDIVPPIPNKWETQLRKYSDDIRRVSQSTGVFEITNSPNYKWLGTAFVVGDNHVAVADYEMKAIFNENQQGKWVRKKTIIGNPIEGAVFFC